MCLETFINRCQRKKFVYIFRESTIASSGNFNVVQLQLETLTSSCRLLYLFIHSHSMRRLTKIPTGNFSIFSNFYPTTTVQQITGEKYSEKKELFMVYCFNRYLFYQLNSEIFILVFFLFLQFHKPNLKLQTSSNTVISPLVCVLALTYTQPHGIQNAESI